jgi:hypothetical protein
LQFIGSPSGATSWFGVKPGHDRRAQNRKLLIYYLSVPAQYCTHLIRSRRRQCSRKRAARLADMILPAAAYSPNERSSRFKK